jgi:hypothetical protein
MVDQQLTSILWVFMVDMGIFLLELMIFFCVRKQRGDALFNTNAAQKHSVKIEFDLEDLKKDFVDEMDFMASREVRERATITEKQPEATHKIIEDDDDMDTRFQEIGQRHGATIAVIKRRDFKSRALKTPILLGNSAD